MKKLMMIGAVLCSGIAVAMPTRKELASAQPMVNEVLGADMKALKAKAKSPEEVAAKHMELAAKAGSEAERYLLLQGAFNIYAKAGRYEEAAKALETMNAEIKDMNPEVIVEIYNKAIFSSMKEKAPKLHAIKESAKRLALNRRQLTKLEAAVKADPKNPKTQRALGECCAELGDWDKALAAFEKADGDLAGFAKAEREGSKKPQEIADFWWTYNRGETAYRAHAASLYREALNDDAFKGLVRERAENRVKEIGDANIKPVVRSGAGDASPVLKGKLASRTLDLGGGLTLDMIGCPAGEFDMGEDGEVKPGEVRKHKVKITRPFLLGKFPVTVEQWTKIVEKKDVKDRFAINNKSFGGKEEFFALLNNRFKTIVPKGYRFRLPTEAELSYAMTSGGKDIINSASVGVLGPSEADKISAATRKGQKVSNKWHVVLKPTEVGLNKANTWGFYDVIGNGMQSTLDIVAPGGARKFEPGEKGTVKSLAYADSEVDPLSWDHGKPGAMHLFLNLGSCGQGGFWSRNAVEDYAWNDTFRVCLGPDLVTEKQKAKKK